MPTPRIRHIPNGLYAGTRFVSATSAVWRSLSKLESLSIGTELDDLPIEKPVFVCGLARSGSTIITELINQHPAVTSHRYSDFPLIWLPFWWNRLRQHLPLPEQTPTERAHADRIMVTNDSPEAIEEVLWTHYFPDAHIRTACHLLDEDHRNADFDAYYAEHIRKLMLVRQRTRYLAKNNYNVTRLNYLLSLFPDARFVIPVRQPESQIASSCKQHKLFEQQAAGDPRVARQLRMSAHFEFGPQRCPILVSADKQNTYNPSLSDAAWYAHQWNDVYGLICQQLASNPNLASACLILPYESLCADTSASLQALFSHIDLTGPQAATLIQRNLHQLSEPQYYDADFSKTELETIHSITNSTAERLAELT